MQGCAKLLQRRLVIEQAFAINLGNHYLYSTLFWEMSLQNINFLIYTTTSIASVIHRKEAIKDSNMLHEIEKEFRKNSRANTILKELRVNQEECI